MIEIAIDYKDGEHFHYYNRENREIGFIRKLIVKAKEKNCVMSVSKDGINCSFIIQDIWGTDLKFVIDETKLTGKSKKILEELLNKEQ